MSRFIVFPIVAFVAFVAVLYRIAIADTWSR